MNNNMEQFLAERAAKITAEISISSIEETLAKLSPEIGRWIANRGQEVTLGELADKLGKVGFGFNVALLPLHNLSQKETK